MRWCSTPRSARGRSSRPRPSPASWPAPWSSWARRTGVRDPRAADRHGRAAGPRPSATRSRWPSRWRCWPAAGPPDVVELTLALAREMLDAAGLDGVDPARDAARRLGDGPVPRAGRRAGWRLCRNRCRSVRTPRPSRHPAVARWATSTRWRWDWRCGGSARAARLPVSACSPAPACASTAGPASPSPRASRCSRCTPTPRSGSTAALAELDGGWSVGDSAARRRVR